MLKLHVKAIVKPHWTDREILFNPDFQTLEQIFITRNDISLRCFDEPSLINLSIESYTLSLFSHSKRYNMSFLHLIEINETLDLAVTL